MRKNIKSGSVREPILQQKVDYEPYSTESSITSMMTQSVFCERYQQNLLRSLLFVLQVSSLLKQKKAEKTEEFVTIGGKIEKLPLGPKPSKFAEELEELLIGSTGNSMLCSDPVLRNLLAVKGTFTHATFNRLAKKLKLLMPENSLFLPKAWSGLEKLLVKRLPWKHGQSPDLILVDRSSGKIAIVDLTRKSRPSHIKVF